MRHFGLGCAFWPSFAMQVGLLGACALAAEQPLGELLVDPSGKWITLENFTPDVLEKVKKLSDANKSEVLQLFVRSELAAPPPVGGSVTVGPRGPKFTPRFPLVRGTRYLIMQKPPLVARATALEF